ncbi:protein GrpE [Clostridia bacterium]|nr:protein GrpE [Clostridia bacterium]
MSDEEREEDTYEYSTENDEMNTIDASDVENIEIDPQLVEDEEEPEKELEAAKREAAANLDKYQRVLAEFDNFRKRTAKEKAGIYGDGVRDTLEKLLPVADNFERALNACEDKDNALYSGIEKIQKQLTAFFADVGAEEIKAVGEIFDTNFHFAVAHEESKEHGENTIIEELQKGYKYKDKVIRCSMVKVAN